MTAIGINSLGVYVPFYFIPRTKISDAWGDKEVKGSKSMANVDEDSITMAVEASSECFNLQSKDQIDALFFASTTGPYSEKSHATLISTALDLKSDLFVSDFTSSLRSGTNALRAAFVEVSSGYSNSVMVTSADKRNGYPKSSQELFFGDAAAAVTVGKENVIATLDNFASVQNEIHDFWRNKYDDYLRSAEGRFAIEEGYDRSIKDVLNKILKTSGMKLSSFSKIIFTSPGAKENIKLAKKLNISLDQLQDNFTQKIGVVGTPQPILMLIDAIENSNTGDKILLVSYGNGADAFIFTVTDEIKRLKGKNSINKFLSRRQEFNDYGRFLSFRKIIQAVPGEPFKIPASTSKTWREQDTYLKLYGSKCTVCGKEIFPVNRVCANCGSLDRFEIVKNVEKITQLYTYSVDYLAGRCDNPKVIQAVMEDHSGTRFYLNMTDYSEDEIEIGMDLEFTFRIIHELGNFPNYYWKVRPVRRKRDKK